MNSVVFGFLLAVFTSLHSFTTQAASDESSYSEHSTPLHVLFGRDPIPQDEVLGAYERSDIDNVQVVSKDDFLRYFSTVSSWFPRWKNNRELLERTKIWARITHPAKRDKKGKIISDLDRFNYVLEQLPDIYELNDPEFVANVWCEIIKLYFKKENTILHVLDNFWRKNQFQMFQYYSKGDQHLFYGFLLGFSQMILDLGQQINLDEQAASTLLYLSKIEDRNISDSSRFLLNIFIRQGRAKSDIGQL